MKKEQSLSIVWCFRQSISLTFRNFFAFFGAAILACFFSILTIGFMFPCLMTGLENMYLRAKAGDKMKATDVFAHRRQWWSFYCDSVALAWHSVWPVAILVTAYAVLFPVILETVDPRYTPSIMISYLVALILLGLWSLFRESKYLHALNLAAEFGLKGADSRHLSKQSVKSRLKDTIFVVLLAVLTPLLFFSAALILLGFSYSLIFLPITLLLLTLTMGATAMAFLHDLGEKQEILELIEKYLEAYKKPVGKPENPCPTCDNSNVRWAYIEDGSQESWCPDCMMSLKKMRGFI